MFKIMKSGFYCTKLEQINSRKLLNLLFKHIFPINDPNMAMIIPILFVVIISEPGFSKLAFMWWEIAHFCCSWQDRFVMHFADNLL